MNLDDIEDKLNVKPATIREVFNDEFYFYVPDFQRNYAWKSNPKEDATERQVDQLLVDIHTSFKNNYDSYFLGTIITYNDNSNLNSYYLIDGQQRITTLSILIRCIAKRLRDLKEDEASITKINKYYHRTFNDAPHHVIETSNKSNSEYLREFFGKDEKPLSKDYPNSKQISDAVKTCEIFIKEVLKTRNKTNEFLDYLSKHVYFAWVKTEDFLDAFTIFERQNDRGAPLSFSDTVKHYLLSQLASTKSRFEREAPDINKKWEQIHTDIHKKARFNFDTFLRYFFISEFTVFKTKAQLMPWLRSSDGQDITNMAEDPHDFIKKLEKSAENFILIRSNNDTDGIENTSLKFIKSYFSVQQHLPVVLAAANNGDKKVFNKVCQLMESLIFVYSWADTKWNELEKNLEELCRYLHKENNDRNKYKKFFNKINTMIEGEITKAYSNITNNEYLEDISKNGAPLIAKYIPHRIEWQVRLESDISQLLPKLQNQDRINIDVDHILERKNEITQKEATPPEFKSSYKEYVKFRNRIGNLTLLASQANKDSLKDKTPYQKIVMKLGYGKSICMITNLMHSEYFLPTDEDKEESSTQSDKVIHKYKIKGPLKLHNDKYLSEDIIILREKYIFNILSQAIGYSFSPHKDKYKIEDFDNTIENWKKFYKSYKI